MKEGFAKKNNGTAVQGIWLGIANCSNMIVAILSSIVLSRYFDKIEYGTYKQIIFVYNTFLLIFQAGLPSVFSFFLPRYSIQEGKYIMRKLNMMLFILGLLFSIFLFVFSDLISDVLNNPELADGLKIFSIFPLFTLPTLGIEGLYVALKNTKFIAGYQILTRILMLCCIVLPIILIEGASYKLAILGWGFASVISFFIALWAKAKPYRHIIAEKIAGISKQILRYSLPIMGSSLVLLFFNSVNQIFISRYCGVESFAVFSNGFIALPFIPIFIAPFRQLLVPIFSKASQHSKYEDAIITFNNGIIKISIILLPLIVFSAFFAKDIMVFLYGEQYAPSTIYFQIMLVFHLFELFPFTVVLSSIGRTDIQFKIDIICTVFIYMLNIVFVYLHIISPILITAIFVLINASMRYIIPYMWMAKRKELKKLLNKNTIRKVLLTAIHSIIAVSISSIICYYFIYNELNVFLRLCIGCFIFGILLVITAPIFKINYLDYLSIIRRNRRN